MKKVRVEKFGGFDQLKIVDAPEPAIETGQIGVEMRAAGLNFADVVAVSGHDFSVPHAPYDPGSEIAGTVYQVGADVEGFQIGDRVVALASGAMQEKVAVGAQNAVIIPDDLDFAPATALLVQGLTAYFVLEDGELKAGDTVLIGSAAGGVGSLAIQMAKNRGAGKVIGLASKSKHERVLELGADAVFDYHEKGWGQKVTDATDGKDVDIWLDSSGDMESEGFDALAQGGRWMFFGERGDKDAPLEFARVMTMLGKRLSLRGYNLHLEVEHPEKIARALSEMLGWFSEGKLRIDADFRFPLADAPKAFEAISNSKTSGKVVLEN